MKVNALISKLLRNGFSRVLLKTPYSDVLLMQMTTCPFVVEYVFVRGDKGVKVSYSVTCGQGLLFDGRSGYFVSDIDECFEKSQILASFSAINLYVDSKRTIFNSMSDNNKVCAVELSL